MTMSNIDLEKYKSAWKEEKSLNKETLTDSEIKNYLMKRSKGLIGSFKTVLVIDIVLKVILGASFVVLIFLFPLKVEILGLCIASIILLIYMLWLNIVTYRKIPGQKEYSGDIMYFLKSRIEFYRTKFYKSIYVFALSNPFIFISGMLFYFYFKYGGMRTLQIDDVIVFSLICIAGFIIGAFSQVKQYNFQIGQMEECLKELKEDGINEFTIRKQKKQKRTLFMIFTIALILGLVLLVFLLTSK